MALATAKAPTFDGVAELPRYTFDTTMPVRTGRTIAVPSGQSLQTAINSAVPGDEIVLDAGGTYTGGVTLPKKTGNDWIVIRSSGALPAAGTRVVPGDAPKLAKIVTNQTGVPAFQTAAGAHHYRLTGLEITADSLGVANFFLYAFLELGDGGNAQADMPHDLVLDRCYVHGTPTLEVRRGVALNCGTAAVIDCTISEIHATGTDSQAICGWNGSGPYLIQNNHLEGAAENVMIGGAEPRIVGSLPRDIVISGNTISKPLSWKGSAWTVKNLLELKLGQRLLIEGNTIENNWVAAQAGFAIVFMSGNENGTAPWSEVSDVTFRNNIVRNTPAGLDVMGNGLPSVQVVRASRFSIKNNLFYNVGTVAGTTSGVMFQVRGVNDMTFDHNTAVHNTSVGRTVNFGENGSVIANERFIFTNNIVTRAEYGIFGSGTQEGAPTLGTYAPGVVFTGNVLIAAPSASYGAFATGNYFPATLAEVGFINPSQGDYNLSSTSQFLGRGATTVVPVPVPVPTPTPVPVPTPAYRWEAYTITYYRIFQGTTKRFDDLAKSEAQWLCKTFLKIPAP